MSATALGLARRWARPRRRAASASTLLIAGGGLLGLIALAGALAPLLAPDPNAQDLAAAFTPPSFAHPMGTDSLGRDVLSRALHAARVDLVAGFVLTFVPLVTGVVLGLVAGYFRGVADTLVMRLVDVVVAFPFMVLVILLLAVLGPGLGGVYIAVFCVAWSAYARLTRAEMLVLRERQFMLAAESLGLSRRRIMLRHALPNVLRPNLVFAMADVVFNILLLASLSFLGLGVRPPTPEWGAMIAEGQQYLVNAWWLTALPGAMVVVVGVALSLVGDGLAERLGEHSALTTLARRGERA